MSVDPLTKSEDVLAPAIDMVVVPPMEGVLMAAGLAAACPWTAGRAVLRENA
jgi:hypothetical protein